MLLRRILDFPSIYSRFQFFLARQDRRQCFFSKYIVDTKGKRILDLGCGTADILDYIQDEALYVGIDINEKYIQDDMIRFSSRKTCFFYNDDLNHYSIITDQKFDIVLMLGVIHHISDEEVDGVMNSINRIIADDGLFVSADACYTRKMNPIARILCKMDRGRYVRYASDYVTMQKKYWRDVQFDIRTDTLSFLPYSLIIFTNRNRIGDCQ